MAGDTEVGTTALRSAELARQARDRVARRTDRLFVGLLLAEWTAAVALALWVSPLAWAGTASRVHAHLWAALLLGLAAVGPPVALGVLRPGRTATRHAIAVGQMAVSALLIHLTGGRIETHFHVFGSLAFLAFYRDWRVLVTATVVTVADHVIRGAVWPASAYGTPSGADWRWAEHAGWVLFIDLFLAYSCLVGDGDLTAAARRQADLEAARAGVEREVDARTAELRAGEERFRLLFEANPHPMWVYDRATLHFLAVNAAAVRQYGYSREEFARMTLRDIRPEDEVPRLEAAVAGLGAAPTLPAVWRHRRKDGTVIAVEVSGTDVSDGGRAARQVAAVDVSDRVRAEAERERASALLAAVANGTPDAVFVKDRDGRYLLFNAAAARFVGKAVADVLGRDDTALFGPADAAVVMAHDRRVMATGLAETTEESLTAAGVRRTYLATKAPYRAADGTVVGVLGISRDITDRKRADDELRRSEGQFRGAFDDTGVAMVLTDIGNRFLRVNAAFADLFGYAAAEMVGMTMAEVTHPDDAAASYAQREFLLAGATRYFQIEKRYVHRDGRTVWGLTNVSLVRDPDGRPALYVGQVQDITERKRAEAALREEREVLRLVLDNIPQGVFWKDRDSRYLGCNRVVAEAAGFADPAVMVGRTDADLPDRTPAEAVFFVRKDREVMAAGVPQFHIREPKTLASGRTIWLDTNKVPLRDADGRVVGVLGTWEDVTDRQKAEERLERSQALLAVASRVGRMGAWAAEVPAYTVAWSDELRAIYELPPERTPGVEEGLLFYAAEDRDAVRAAFTRCAQDGTPFDLEARFDTARGRRQWARVIGEAVRNAGGDIVRVQGAFQDISERKAADEALRHQHALLRGQTEASPDGILVVGPGNRLLSRNRRFLDLWGIPPELAESGEDAPILAFARSRAADPDEFLARVAAIYDDPASQSHDEVALADGRTLDRYSGPIRAADGDLLGRVWYFRDITEGKRLEAQLRQAQKMEAVGQLAGGIAHDFNNLLTIINGYSELVRMGLPVGDPAVELVTEILHAGERSAALTRQLLAFSRQQVLAPRVLDLNAVVADTEKMLRRLIGEDVRLTASLAADLGAVVGDPGQVEQVLMNLAVNARDAMPTGGRLTIETRNVELDGEYAVTRPDARPGPHVLLAVTDSGSGIPPGVLARVFEPFFSTKGPGRGTGLGLATVHGIVRQSGGHVTAYSEVGVGTTFKVYLPRVKGDDGGQERTASIIALGGAERVLVVEDDDAVRGLTVRILNDRGYAVIQAADGEEAVRAAAECLTPIDLVITDVVMPGTGGRLAAARVAEWHPGVKVLFVSGYTDDAVVRHGVLHEGTHFLQKPFTSAALAAKVREVLDGRE